MSRRHLRPWVLIIPTPRRRGGDTQRTAASDRTASNAPATPGYSATHNAPATPAYTAQPSSQHAVPKPPYAGGAAPTGRTPRLTMPRANNASM